MAWGGAWNGERGARNGWRRARFELSAPGNRGRRVEPSGGGRGFGRETPEEQAGRRDERPGRRNEKAERREAKGERIRSVRKRRTTPGAARGVRRAAPRGVRRTLHESAERPCEGAERRQARVGRRLGRGARRSLDAKRLTSKLARRQAEPGRRCEVAERIRLQSRDRHAGARALEAQDERLSEGAERPRLEHAAPREESGMRVGERAGVRDEEAPLGSHRECPEPRHGRSASGPTGSL